MAFNQTDVLTTVAYLMGERTLSTSTTSQRADFAQQSLEEAYAAYPWRFATTTATITVVSGIASLPTVLDIGHPMFASYYTGTTQIDLEPIDLNDSDQYTNGDNRFWTTAQSDGTFLLNTKDTTAAAVVVNFQAKAPIINASVATPYPNKMTIALGARRYVKLGQNPDADISQEEKKFDVMLSKDIAAAQVPSPRKRRRTRQSMTGNSTGDF